MPSSTTTALSRQPLAQALKNVTDPRDRRGVRHPLISVLCLAVVGVLAGCRSLTAIWEHAADLEPADLGALGLEAGRALPSESTIRRVLKDLDPAGLDARAGLLVLHPHRRHRRPQGDRRGRQDHARGPHRLQPGPPPPGGPGPGRRHGPDPEAGGRQVQRDTRAEGPARPLDLDGAVAGADAMHTQTGTAEWIRSRGAHYLLTVKNNQPGLKRALEKLPWKDVPSTSVPDGSHGRRVRRTVQAVEAPAWIDFPGAAQVIRIRRTRTVKGRKHIEVVHLICFLPMDQAQPEAVASWARGHWTIENRLH